MTNTLLAYTEGTPYGSLSVQDITADLFTRWIEYIDATPRTVATYTRSIKQFYLWLQDRGITQPRREDIKAYKAYLQEAHKATTAQNYLTAVKLFFKWTASEGIYPNIADRVKNVKVDNTVHKRDYLTDTQVRRVLSGIDRGTLSGKRDYAIIALMVTTGLREISIARANIEDLGIKGGETVLYYQGKGRTEKADAVFIIEEVYNAIMDYLGARGETDKTKALFASIAHRNAGEPMTTISISRLIKQRLKAVGIDSERLTGHSLRHSAGTIAAQEGITRDKIQKTLGHRNSATTEIYLHDIESRGEVESAVGKRIFG